MNNRSGEYSGIQYILHGGSVWHQHKTIKGRTKIDSLIIQGPIGDLK